MRLTRNEDVHLEHFHLTIQAAIAGLGWAIASRFMVEDELASRVLEAPRSFVADGSAYFLLSEDAPESDPRKACILQWLRRELGRDRADAAPTSG